MYFCLLLLLLLFLPENDTLRTNEEEKPAGFWVNNQSLGLGSGVRGQDSQEGYHRAALHHTSAFSFILFFSSSAAKIQTSSSFLSLFKTDPVTPPGKGASMTSLAISSAHLWMTSPQAAEGGQQRPLPDRRPPELERLVKSVNVRKALSTKPESEDFIPFDLSIKKCRSG